MSSVASTTRPANWIGSASPPTWVSIRLFLLRYRRSHRDTLWTRNFATMGFALPAAVAAAAADGVPTIAVMGDGGMGMAMGGLGALGHGAPPVLAVVLDNGRLGAIRYEQELSGWPEFESGLTNGDLAGYARASGWHGVTIADTPSLEIAIDAFLTDRTPTVLHVLCTPDEAPVPAGLPTPPKQRRWPTPGSGKDERVPGRR